MTRLVLKALLAAVLAPLAAAAEDPGKAWEAAASVGENHRRLDAMAGTWTARVRMWGQPGAAPQESAGTSEIKWVLGGRFLEQRFEGTFMGKPFTGLGHTGYDNLAGEYVSTWMDSGGTSIMVSRGKAPKAGRPLVMVGSYIDPMTRKPKKTREVFVFSGQDAFTFEMWTVPGKGAAPAKEMEIAYARKG